MLLYRTLLLLIAGAVLNGCSAQLASTGSSGTSNSYSENLSAYRPKTAVDSSKKAGTVTPVEPAKTYVTNPTLNVNKKVDAVLDSIDRLNQLRRFVEGYTVQVYSGTSREEAMETKRKMMGSIPGLTSNLQYNQPKFRVTAGAYFTRLEAQKDLMHIKQFFPNSILVPERVPIR